LGLASLPFRSHSEASRFLTVSYEVVEPLLSVFPHVFFFAAFILQVPFWFGFFFDFLTFFGPDFVDQALKVFEILGVDKAAPVQVVLPLEQLGLPVIRVFDSFKRAFFLFFFSSRAHNDLSEAKSSFFVCCVMTVE